ncbi:DMT family transporter [Sediminitomix flava]|uniref:Putative membrane protein n=1 Tax=Sediminitomix flava TaxID=379075 RepID=A0A315Z963_SEDFL|nr:DMT family transporter [Sediminitomix flava]PWJ42041.1 putative membrane protein [Sediminitomix flava]
MLKDQLKLHLIVFIWGFTAILGKEISINSTELVMYRTLFSALGLGIVLFLSGKKEKLLVNRKGLLKLIGTGFLVGLHWICFFIAAKLSVSVCLAGIATCSLFTAFLEPIIKRQRVKVYEIILGMFTIFGLYLIFKFEFNHVGALGFALVASVLAATFSAFNTQHTNDYAPTAVTFYEMLGGFLISLALMPIMDNYFPAEDGALFHNLSMKDWGLLMLLTQVCTVYAFYVSIELMKRMTAFQVSLTNNLEPVYGIIMALIFYPESETMSVGFYMGTAVILSSVIAYPICKRLAAKSIFAFGK